MNASNCVSLSSAEFFVEQGFLPALVLQGYLVALTICFSAVVHTASPSAVQIDLNQDIATKCSQLSHLPNEFANCTCHRQWGTAYLPQEIFRFVVSEQAFWFTGEVRRLLDKEVVKRDLALPGRAEVQSN